MGFENPSSKSEWESERDSSHEKYKEDQRKMQESLKAFEESLSDDVGELKSLRSVLEDEWTKETDSDARNMNMDKRNILNDKLQKMGVDRNED
ncbi:MAG: hypothetical protein COU07_01415 [Candidatus Harrisonbacteria bacterium CG10_big_fil_rev_8_21_14_0_10_40_38]|uniref:Uncharacterized protein n=1 Tax=Candidatus Harrisonbacteria bacterium CG10_big_fil_rev_8_21_14_0_10_40_38 TaxID=1974583 RepID=A0A2H0USZ7_9BACT|nr:MAG: hypothetical protein COU07_01415 [Candidatus Harrisonbacteria bacterium CG10_big_fil_rev_8_21_14_0_10_40_38]